MEELKGHLVGNNAHVGIVIARFNEFVTKSLLEGALDGLERMGVSKDKISIVWVPGSVEIPLAAKQLALSHQPDAIICLGAVIRGATAHFDYVANQCSSGIGQLSLEFNIPFIFGVLTTDTIEQAIERAGTKAGNKGYEAAQTAIEMIDLLKKMKTHTSFSSVQRQSESFHIKK